MPKPRIRVLVDLSMAARGYCGISQDVRLLYKTLSLCPEIEVTGLVYQPRKFGWPHRFSAAGVPLSRRIANQAEFLWKLAEADNAGGDTASRRASNWLRLLAKTTLISRARVAPLDTERFWPTLWRQLFEQSLMPEDLPLVRRGKFLISDLSDGVVFARALAGRSPVRLDTRGYDFLIVQGPRPFRVSPGTRHITRYHDMIPVLNPDTMRNPLVIRWHHEAIRQSAESMFVCNSEPTRDDLQSVYPECGSRSITIPYARSDGFWREESTEAALRILQQRRSAATGVTAGKPLGRCPRYLMSVSTLEPRKNFVGLIQAFNQVKNLDSVRREAGRLKLVIVGGLGWKHAPILDAMRQLVAQGELIHLEKVPAQELRILYTHAEAVVFPSFAEGFGFPPLEALQCGTPVIASDLAAHRWVLGDAALYCDPYAVSSIAAAIERLITTGATEGLRARLVEQGRRRVEHFNMESRADDWQELFEKLRGGGGLTTPAPVLSPSLPALRPAA